MDESTIPLGAPELMRSSAFQRYLDELSQLPTLAGTPRSQLTSLSPSLLADLQRFEQRTSGGTDVLEVLASCLRHAQRVVLHLEVAGFVVPITVFPRQRLVHCPADTQDFLLQRVAQLRLLRVEPAVLQPPGGTDPRLIAPLVHYHPIAAFLWRLALQGSRSELLPEIAGNACYRVTPGLELNDLPMTPAQRATLRNMRGQPLMLRDVAELTGQGRDGAARLLNALYLQSGLIVSRTLLVSQADSWFASLGLRRRGES